jgi:hypothetical protein
MFLELDFLILGSSALDLSYNLAAHEGGFAKDAPSDFVASQNHPQDFAVTGEIQANAGRLNNVAPRTQSGNNRKH